MQDRYGAVFAVMVQIAGHIRVSRYNFNKLLILKYVVDFSIEHLSSVALQTYNETSIESRYTSIIGSSCGYPGLYCITYLSRKQAQFAKTVTSLLILLTVLCIVYFTFFIKVCMVIDFLNIL